MVNIKKLFFKEEEEVIVLPYQDELHLTGIPVQKDIVALDDVCVTRHIIGDIYCAKSIVVCKNVHVVGNIYCRTGILNGNIVGNVSACEMLEIKANALIEGNIHTPKLNVSPAAILNGYITSISLKDSRRIYSVIKFKMNQIGRPGMEKEIALPATDGFDNLPDDAEQLEPTPQVPVPQVPISQVTMPEVSTPQVSIIDLSPERVEVPATPDNNDKWW